MGRELERWLIAKGNVFAPSAAAIVKLVTTLRAEGYLVDPADTAKLERLAFRGPRQERARRTGGYAVRTVPNSFGDDAHAKLLAGVEPLPAALSVDWLDDASREEIRLVWPVSGDGELPVKTPLTMAPPAAAWSLEIHRAADYVYPVGETIDPLDTSCPCGEDLEFEWDPDELISAFGPAIGIFAECDDCSRTYDPAKRMAAIRNPFDGSEAEVRGGAAYRFALKVVTATFAPDPRLAFAPELVEIVSKEFGRDFYEVATLA